MYDYATHIEFLRRSRNEHLCRDAGSPLTRSAREDFPELSYFDVDPAYRLTARFSREPRPREVIFDARWGEVRQLLRVGRVDFVLPGSEIRRLSIFLPLGRRARALYLPFRDGTSGIETYGAGRALELVEKDFDVYELDFNLAFHPFGAYDPSLSSALPPGENWLDIPIRAGERLPPDTPGT